MSEESAAILAEWRTVYHDLFPYRDPNAMAYTDSELALAVMLTRKIVTQKLPARHAEGTEGRITARSKKKGTKPK